MTAHHGSLSKEKRLDAEARLKGGQLKALVATASLELGIDIGHVDLVCQIGSPHRIATLLQRVGRSGHTVSGTPKGRVFPMSRDDLIETLALLRAVRRGELDCVVSHDAPLDVLAQQIVAETVVPRVHRGRAVRARAPGVAVSRRSSARRSIGPWRWSPRASRRDADAAARWCIATRCTIGCAAGAAHGCSRSPRAAPFRKSPTIAWCSSPTTRSSAR